VAAKAPDKLTLHQTNRRASNMLSACSRQVQ
jgi:hypothetical protein